MPTGDTLAEAVTRAEFRAEVIDEKQASISVDPSATAAVGNQVAPDTGVAANQPDNTFPTAEEIATLRRVADRIPLKVFTIAFVELCERFSYYGTTIVCKSTKELPL